MAMPLIVAHFTRNSFRSFETKWYVFNTFMEQLDWQNYRLCRPVGNIGKLQQIF
jgi:hypothetical protein